MLPKTVIGEYDLNDNCIRQFDNYKEVAAAFKTTTKVIQSSVSRIKSGDLNATYDKELHKWVRLYKINIDYKDENDLKNVASITL